MESVSDNVLKTPVKVKETNEISDRGKEKIVLKAS